MTIEEKLLELNKYFTKPLEMIDFNSICDDNIKYILLKCTFETFWELHITCKRIYMIVKTYLKDEIRKISRYKIDKFFYNKDGYLTDSDNDDYVHQVNQYGLMFPSSAPQFLNHNPLKITYSFDGPKMSEFTNPDFVKMFLKTLAIECKEIGCYEMIKFRCLKKFYFTPLYIQPPLYSNTRRCYLEEDDVTLYLRQSNYCNTLSLKYDIFQGRWLVQNVLNINVLYSIYQILKNLLKCKFDEFSKFTIPVQRNVMTSIIIYYLKSSWRDLSITDSAFWYQIRDTLLRLVQFHTIIIWSTNRKRVHFYDEFNECEIGRLYYTPNRIQVLTKNFISFRRIWSIMSKIQLSFGLS